MTTETEQAHRLLFVTEGEIGPELRRRRESLGLSVRQLASLAQVDRGRLSALESSDPAVRASTIGAVRSTLDRLEHEMGQTDTPDLVTNTIELPDGTKVTFVGPADGVAEAAAKFLASHSPRDT